MRYRKITITVSDTVAAIVLPRPDGGRSIDEDTAEELIDCCRLLHLEDGVRVVTITGNGDVFAVGRQNPPSEVAHAPINERLDWLARMGVSRAVASLPMPTVAILNGDAIAHGLELALAADLRVAASTARLGMGSLSECGFPYDGGTQRLPRLVGPGLARDMLFTGRELSAPDALDLGLVHRIAPRDELDHAAAALVGEIIAAAPIASRYAREAVRASGDLTLAQGLRLEADLSVILQSTEDRAEGLRSFAEKRTPDFTGR